MLSYKKLKQLIIQKVHQIGQENFEEKERKVLYKIIEESPESFIELSKMIDEDKRDLKIAIVVVGSKLGKNSARDLLHQVL